MADPGVVEIKIPKESVSDDTVLILDWHVPSGAKIQKGASIAALETSKSAFELEASADGFLFYARRAGEQIPVGEIIAVIAPDENFSFAAYRKPSFVENSSDKASEEIRFSKSALDLLAQHNLRKEVFLPARMVTKEDVLRYLKQNAPLSKPPAPNGRVLILGGGGHAKMCIDILLQMKNFEIAGIIDQNLVQGSQILGIPVLGGNDDLERLYRQGIRLIVNGVGAVTHHPLREVLYSRLKEIGFEVPNIIHPKAAIEKSAVLGEGNQVMAHATVGSSVTVHNNCIINSGSIVSHDSILHDNVHIAPGAILAGGVEVAKNSLIGMGCTIYLNVHIGENVVIQNGCNIHQDVPSHTVIKNG